MRVNADIHPEIANVELSARESGLLVDAAADLYPEFRELSEAEVLDRFEALSADFSRDGLSNLAAAIAEFASHEAWRVMVIHGPKIDDKDIGQTPDRYLGPDENPLLKPDLYRGIVANFMGAYAYGYTSQQPGVRHNNVIAIAGEARKGISANAALMLGLHTEDASYHKGIGRNASPSYVTNHFLRNPEGAPTVVALPDWSQLPNWVQDVLRREFFYNHTNPGQGGDTYYAEIPTSVIYGDATNPHFRINTEEVGDPRYTSEEVEALREFGDLLVRSTVDLPTRAGDIVLLDNRRLAHGRKPYAPRLDGYGRWQRRLVFAHDSNRIKPFETSPDSRVLDTAKFLVSLTAA